MSGKRYRYDTATIRQKILGNYSYDKLQYCFSLIRKRLYDDADCKEDRDTLMAILHIVFMMMLTAKIKGTHWWRYYTLCLWWCWLQRWQGHIDGDTTHCVYNDADCKDDRDTLMATLHIVFMMMLTAKMTGTHWWR